MKSHLKLPEGNLKMHIKDSWNDSVIQPPGSKPGKLIKYIDEDVMTIYLLWSINNENKQAKTQLNGTIAEDWLSIL